MVITAKLLAIGLPFNMSISCLATLILSLVNGWRYIVVSVICSQQDDYIFLHHINNRTKRLLWIPNASMQTITKDVSALASETHDHT